MNNYDMFYRQYGLRRKDKLLNPDTFAYEQFYFPKGSVLHYLGENALDEGPDPKDAVFKTVPGSSFIFPVTENGDIKGTPRRLPTPADTLAKQFLNKNRFFKRIVNFDSVNRDERSLIICNYGLLPQLYAYPRSIYSDYNAWWNKYMALWKNIEEMSKISNRQHFIFIKLPKVLPKPADLAVAANGITQTSVNKFDNGESLMQLELWKWIGQARHQSSISTLSKAALQKVNIVVLESGRWTAYNLGVLDSWRRATDEELEADGSLNKKGISAVTLGKIFVNMQIRLASLRSGDVAVTDNVKTVDTAVNTGKETVDSKIKNVKDAPVTISTPDNIKEEDNPESDDTIEFDDADLDKNIDELNAIHDKMDTQAEDEGPTLSDFEASDEKSFESGVQSKCDALAESGGISAAQYRTYNDLALSYKKIPSPDGNGVLADFIKIKPEHILMEDNVELSDIETVADKSMLRSSLMEFDKRYIRNVLHRDVANMVMGMQNFGIAITNYEVEREEDMGGAFDNFTIRVAPVEGANSTVRFKLPVLADDGTYVANGTKYRLRKQRGEVPIRKISKDTIALSSYYGKVFIARSDKRVNNYAAWLTNQLMAMGLDDKDQRVTSIYPGNVFDNKVVAPRLYTILAERFKAFDISKTTDGKTTELFTLNFDFSKRNDLYGEKTVSHLESNGLIIVGANHDNSFYLLMDKNDVIYKHDGKNTLTEIGYLEDYLGLDTEKAPVDVAELRLMGKTIPIGIILGYQLGLDNLIKLLGATVRRVEAGRRLNLQPHEYSVAFSDETLIFSKYDKKASLILSGFNNYHSIVREFSVLLFDKPGVYLNVLEAGGLTARYLREIDLMDKMFIDPITREILLEMKEPTTFKGLLTRSCEMLMTDAHPDAFDSRFMRTKGYERMAGAVYSELVKSIRAHNGRVGKAKLPLDFNPHAVWKNISEDPSVSLVSDINPIENLKQMEAVTYGGTGGRNSRSMTKHTRSYHENDMGVISEATVDSGDVGINIFTSANPQFTSLRGLSRKYDHDKMGVTSLVSTSALVSPGADRDDPKRVNFISIQHTHGIACDGYRQAMVRTGYEQIIPHRVSDLFAYSAKQDGKVLSVTDKGIIIEYADGTKQGIEIGRRFGQAAGLTLPHDVVGNVKEGEKFKKQDILAYNSGFFEPDLLNPKQVIYKTSITVKTALMESTATIEDSSAISQRIGKELNTKTTKIKTISIDFDQTVSNLVKIGQKVDADTVLCTIEDSITANNSLFDQESLDTLRILGSQNTPLAKVKGVVDKIEVFYHGDKEDMSPSVLTLVNSGDKDLANRLKAANKPVLTGSVGLGFRIEGEPLALDSIAIRIYITTDVGTGIGDKLVFGNQLKSVIGRVFNNDIITETGESIDAIFGYKSISDRIVMSPEIIGTRTTLLKVIAKQAVKLYRS